MNYFTWSQEYYKDAENILKTIKKYEKALKEGKVKNFEMTNSLIAMYRNIYFDTIRTARLLEEKAKVINNAA